MSASAGKVLLMPKGDYNSATAYAVLDWVRYQGASYVCKQASQGNLPTNTTYWSMLVQDGEDLNAYHINDTAETTLADDDYVPFYDTSATAKRKTLWSNIKSVLKTYFDTLYNKITVSIDSTGTASASAVHYQRVGIDGVYTEIDGTKYMEQTINAQANTDTTFTFSSSEISYASVLDIFAGCKTADYAIPTLKSKTLSVSGSTGTLTLVFNVPTAYALTVRVYIRG